MVEVSPTLVHDGFAGHSGHLTAPQQEALDTFRDNLAKAKLYTPSTDEALASHDEPTLLRFLRARGFQPAAAEKQFASTEQWRKEHDVDGIYPTFDDEEFEHSRRYYPRWTGRRDKHGLPVYVYRLASLEPFQKELDAIPAARRYQRIIALHEFMVRFTLPLCTHLPHPASPTPISSTTSIIDLEHVSFTSMWKLRHHLQEASRLATANYPETVGIIAIVNSPSFFPTIWGWLKGWFDEGTQKKIYVLGKDPGTTLCGLVAVEDLPKVYGGELEWKFEDDPCLDADTEGAIGVMPKGPAVFVDGQVAKPPNPTT